MSSVSPGRVVRTGPYPELTYQAVIVGWFLGAVISISIGYAALILGFSIEGSELAAILGFGILRGMLRRYSIIENNIAQTVASAVNGASSGMMFSIPVIFILGYGDKFDPYLMTFGCIAGAFLGIAFIVPLRKHMIDYERLTYPGGVAVATILKSPGAGMKKAKLLLGAAVTAASLHFLIKFLGISLQEGGWLGELLAVHTDSPSPILSYFGTGAGDESPFENFRLGDLLGAPNYLNGVWYLSLLTIGVGFIAGRGGVAFIIGGFVCYWFLAPVMSLFDMLPVIDGNIISDPEELRGSVFRPVGIGMLIGGAIMGVILAFPLIASAVKSMHNASKMGSGTARDEMPIKLLYMAIIGAAIILAIIAINSVEGVGIGRGLLMAGFGTLWIWMAGVILSEAIGRTNWSPLSGMTLIGVTILIITTAGMDKESAIIAAVMVGAATSVAMSQATDLMLDMKTGYLVGASPRMQQMGQFMGAWLGPILIIGLIFLLDQAYGLGSDRLPAPQAMALKGVIEGIQGGDIPAQKYLAGAGLGGLLSIAQGGLGITVGLGFYLPFNIVLTYALGTAWREIADRRKGKSWSEETGIPIAAGFIVGEALVGVGFAGYAGYLIYRASQAMGAG